MSASTLPLPSTAPLLRLDPATQKLLESRYRIEVSSGPDRGLSLAVDRAVRVGTHPDAALRLKDASVSRFHIELVPRPDGLHVTDLSSRNGTFLGDARVKTAVISREASLRLGTSTLHIVLEESEVDAPEARVFANLVAHAPRMRQILGLLPRIATADASVLLQGETGTGKEAVARAVHDASSRATQPFVGVPCGGMSAELVESELFGHVRGAFTGAVADRDGAFLQANGGTLLLDGVDDLPLSLQPRLLRVLQDGVVQRIGDRELRRVDVRVIATCSAPLEDAVAAQRFRSDLFYRLAVISLTLPPLRERAEDVTALALHFLRQQGGDPGALSPALLDRLTAYSWPGNVRELRNVVAQVVTGVEPALENPTRSGQGTLVRTDRPFKESKEELIDTFTREYLTALHAETDGNVSEMARRSGMARTYLHEKLQRFGLRPFKKP